MLAQPNSNLTDVQSGLALYWLPKFKLLSVQTLPVTIHMYTMSCQINKFYLFPFYFLNTYILVNNFKAFFFTLLFFEIRKFWLLKLFIMYIREYIPLKLSKLCNLIFSEDMHKRIKQNHQ